MANLFFSKGMLARLVFSVSVQDTGKYITSNPLLFLGTLDQSLGKYEKQNDVDGRYRSSEVECFVKTCQSPTNETVIMNNKREHIPTSFPEPSISQAWKSDQSY